jgi:hypothetical protein
MVKCLFVSIRAAYISVFRHPHGGKNRGFELASVEAMHRVAYLFVGHDKCY